MNQTRVLNYKNNIITIFFYIHIFIFSIIQWIDIINIVNPVDVNPEIASKNEFKKVKL